MKNKCNHEVLIDTITSKYDVSCLCPFCGQYSEFGPFYMKLNNNIDRCNITLWNWPDMNGEIIQTIKNLWNEAKSLGISPTQYIKEHEKDLYKMSLPQPMIIKKR